MKAVATVRLKFQRKEQLKAIFDALEPETRTSLSSRSKVSVKKEVGALVLVFEARDTSALRAALNSYLHWIRLTRDVLDNVQETLN
jgi:tRNA threonylcarbamoyladenosine modification (KEOPS) complex  Pcc1 subunit